MDIRGLIDDLFRVNRHNNIPSTLAFKQIDIDGTARRLDLVAKGDTNGKANLPPSSSEAFDVVEQEIVAEIEAQGQRDYAKYLDDQRTYIDRAASAVVQNILIEIGSISRSVISDLNSRVQNGLDHLYVLRKEVIETETELSVFRQRQGLTRPARNLGSRTLKVGILVWILVGEAIANTFIFAQGSEAGLTGGFGIALVVSAFNILIGLLSGVYPLRWLAYKNAFAKAASIFGMLGYIGAAISFNLAVAHFRVAVLSGNELSVAAKEAYTTFIAQPTGIHDLTSWLLFGVGILCSVIALIDGWSFDDPYPGYGQRTRHHNEAAELYAEQKKELLDELESLKNNAEQNIETRLRDIAARRGDYNNVLARSHGLESAMEQHFTHLETAANTLLRIYRTADQQDRTAPTPVHFETRWHYPRQPIVGHSIPDGLRREVEETLKSVQIVIPERHREIVAAYDDALAKYRRIDQLTAQELPNG